MRYRDLTESSRSAPLYHFMDHVKAMSVFFEDAMPARWEHNIPTIGNVMGNSFTRNGRFEFHDRPIRLVMDQAKLAQRHKIMPLDGEAVFRHKWTNRLAPGIRDRTLNPLPNQMAEEFVVGDIKPLHAYLISVELNAPNHYMTGAETIELHEDTVKYCEKWAIPLTVSPAYLAKIEEIKQRWKEYEEEDSEIDEAAPTDNIRGTVFYHGTPKAAAAKAIMKQGLKGADIQGKGKMAPVAGRVYMTNQLRYAITYAMGGDYMGHKLSDHFAEKHAAEPYGYLFVLDGSSLEDVQPDEDSVGEFFYKHAERVGRDYQFKGSTTSREYQIWSFIGRTVTPKQRAEMLFGDYANWAQGGKRALKTMPDWMKHWLIEHGEAHVAATGNIMPKEVWRIDKRKAPKLDKDGTNFFEIAKRLK